MARPRFPAPSLLLLLLLLAPSPAWPAWPSQEASPLWVGWQGLPYWPHVVEDGEGGVLVAWVAFDDRDIYAQRFDASGVRVPGWPQTGAPAFVTGWDTHYFNIAPDGEGGMFVAVFDRANGKTVNANHVLADGTNAPGWPPAASVLGALGEAAYYTRPGIAADGAGGAYVSASIDVDGSPYGDAKVQRLTGAGAPAAGWPGSGVVLASGADLEFWPALLAFPGGVYLCFTTSSGTFVQRLGDDGTVAPGWPAGGIQVGAPSLTQPVLAGDGAGGVVAAWNEGTIAVQRLTAGGTYPPGWSATARTAGQAGAGRTSLELGIAPDRIYVAWSFPRGTPAPGYEPPGDVFAQALDMSGTVLWTPTGHPVAVGEEYQSDVGMAIDPAGGLFLSWMTQGQLSLQHLDPDGGVSPGWPANGRVTSLPADSPDIAIIGDGAAFTTWENSRVYGHRIDRYNRFGEAAAVLSGLDDVAGDQGGVLRLTWDASYLDVATWQQLGAYHVERLAGGLGTAGVSWEPVATVAPDGLAQYVLDVATAGGLSGIENQYRVVAESIDGPDHGLWISGTLAAAALDNLPPDEPPNFAGTTLANGTLELSWDASVAPDLAGYALYRGDDPGFAADAAHLVVETAATSHVVNAAGGSYFKLAAEDVNGNASTYATFDGTALVDVEPARASLALRGMAPNPASSRARVAWSLPQAMDVDLAVFDVTGRRVKTLASGVYAPGEHAADWRLTDASERRLPSGLYFLRLTVPGHLLTRRVVVTD